MTRLSNFIILGGKKLILYRLALDPYFGLNKNESEIGKYFKDSKRLINVDSGPYLTNYELIVQKLL
jgi:hypothetical protein